MAISFVGAGAHGGQGATYPTLPAGLATGDILILQTIYTDVPSQITTGGGWAFVAQILDGRTVWWKRHTAGDPVPAPVSQDVIIYGYRGCKASGSPIGAVSHNFASPGTSLTVASITTTAADSWAVFVAHCNTPGGFLNFTAPGSGPAQVVDDNTVNAIEPDTQHIALIATHGVYATAGAVGSQTIAVVNWSPDEIGGALFELLAEPGGGGGGGFPLGTAVGVLGH